MAIANNAVQNRNEVPYSAVLMVRTKGLAEPGNPFNGEDDIEGTPSVLPLVALADATGNAIGTTGNPLVTTAQLVTNGISVSSGAEAYGGTQSYANGTTNPLQADNTGALKVVVSGQSSGLSEGPTGSPVPIDGTYTAFANAGGILVGVSPSNPMPVTLGANAISGNQAAGSVGSTSPAYAGLTGFTNTGGNLTAVTGATPLPVYADGIATANALSLTDMTITPLNMNLKGELRTTANVAGVVSLTANTAVVVSGNVGLAPGATVTLAGGSISTSSNATANSSAQSFANGTTNSLQADLTGSLKVTLANVSNTAPLPVTVIAGPSGTSQVQVNPTVSTSAYTAGNCVGGKLTFTNAAKSKSGVVQSVTITAKSVQTTGFIFYLFSSDPTNTTWTDHATPSINVADIPYLIDYFPIPNADSALGTVTIWAYDGAGRAFVGNSTSLYGVLLCGNTPTFASTSDLFVTLSVLED